MNADEFFEKHSIEEINKKTRISPISLRFIKNKEFDKLPRVKFVGFVRLIEKRYKVDLSELIEEYENYFNQNDNNKQKEKKETELEKKEEIKEKKSYLWVLVLILFILSAFLYVSFINKNTIENKLNNKLAVEKNITDFSNNESEKSNDTLNNTNTTHENKMIVDNVVPMEKNETNISKINNISTAQLNKKVTEYNITILPNELVWFRALNIDNNKTKEFLTSKPKNLIGNYYIKFGHGNITIIYNDKNITPNTKKIVRILFKNGKYKYLKKPNEYEK
jgi:cytoskeletal protein RodZ